jgi:hypothetical protein
MCRSKIFKFRQSSKGRLDVFCSGEIPPYPEEGLPPKLVEYLKNPAGASYSNIGRLVTIILNNVQQMRLLSGVFIYRDKDMFYRLKKPFLYVTVGGVSNRYYVSDDDMYVALALEACVRTVSIPFGKTDIVSSIHSKCEKALTRHESAAQPPELGISAATVENSTEIRPQVMSIFN